ncbi:MAG TPA: sulfatase [Gemmataceae bacterium]|jgi:N-acetylglucosamine-6-sulfatase
MRWFSILVLLLIALPARAADRPNIVFVLVDDIRWDAFGCMGHPWVKTPNVDRLAREGARFTNFFDTIPLCAPARASFLTGRCCHANGVTDNTNHNALSHRLVTWPRLLHDAGYETAFLGKWHMGNDDTPRPGFDRWVSFKGQGQYKDPPLNIDGKPQKVDGYITDLLDTYAVEFIKKPHTKPFVLYLPHKAVHGPFTPAERHKDLYTREPFTPPASATDDLSGKPALAKMRPNPPRRAGAKPGEGVMRQQLRCLASIDEGLGDILKALEDTGQLDNTLVMFTSDNGYFWGEHGGLGDKRWAYDESIRLPLMVRYPKLIKPGTTIDALTLNIDVAPTMLDLAGVPAPANVHGKSLLLLLRGETAGWRTAILTEYFKDGNYPHPPWRCVRTDRWKYIRYTDESGWDELYDLKADPHEMKNVIKEQSAQAALAELRADLDRQWKATEGK